MENRNKMPPNITVRYGYIYFDKNEHCEKFVSSNQHMFDEIKKKNADKWRRIVKKLLVNTTD